MNILIIALAIWAVLFLLLSLGLGGSAARGDQQSDALLRELEREGI